MLQTRPYRKRGRRERPGRPVSWGYEAGFGWTRRVRLRHALADIDRLGLCTPTYCSNTGAKGATSAPRSHRSSASLPIRLMEAADLDTRSWNTASLSRVRLTLRPPYTSNRKATMKIQVELELTRGVRRAAMFVTAASVLSVGGAVAHAQTGGTITDTSVTSLALSSLRSAVALLQAQVATLQAADHVGRATVSASGEVVTQNGRWLSCIAHPSGGNYVLTFAPGTFSTPPTCVVTALANETVGPSPVPSAVSCSSATPSSVTCQAWAGPHTGDLRRAVNERFDEGTLRATLHRALP